MSDHLKLATDDLERRLAEHLAAASEHLSAAAKLKSAINQLSEIMGISPPYPDADQEANAGSGQIPAPARPRLTFSPDEFFNKPLAACVRQVLEVRRERSAELGPAEVGEIHQALVAGGYNFDSRDEREQLRGLAVSISKNTKTFARLPSGKVVLTEWYGTSSKPRKARVRNGGEMSEDDERADDLGLDEPGQGDQQADESEARGDLDDILN